MNFTIFGYPRTGKTTLFNLLTGAGAATSNYSGKRKEPNQRTCIIPDERFESLCELYPEKKRKPAVIEFTDLAGMAYGDIKTETYLDHLRKAEGLAHVVRAFRAIEVPHWRENVDPSADVKSMEAEMLLTDQILVENRLEKLQIELKRGKTPEWEKENGLMESLKNSLEAGNALRELELSEAEDKLLRSYAFLSRKPLLHMLNLDENDIVHLREPQNILSESSRNTGLLLAFCGRIEMEIMELEEQEKALFLAEYGMLELSPPRFLKASYALLKVVTFFTVGKEEVKSWTIKEDATAQEAAGLIHSDIQQGFIRAEVINWQELLQYGSFQSARESAAVRLEGKNYIINDGDVIFFRFNK